jgi:hypothetical protein
MSVNNHGTSSEGEAASLVELLNRLYETSVELDDLPAIMTFLDAMTSAAASLLTLPLDEAPPDLRFDPSWPVRS